MNLLSANISKTQPQALPVAVDQTCTMSRRNFEYIFLHNCFSLAISWACLVWTTLVMKLFSPRGSEAAKLQCSLHWTSPLMMFLCWYAMYFYAGSSSGVFYGKTLLVYNKFYMFECFFCIDLSSSNPHLQSGFLYCTWSLLTPERNELMLMLLDNGFT